MCCPIPSLHSQPDPMPTPPRMMVLARTRRRHATCCKRKPPSARTRGGQAGALILKNRESILPARPLSARGAAASARHPGGISRAFARAPALSTRPLLRHRWTSEPFNVWLQSQCPVLLLLPSGLDATRSSGLLPGLAF
ncbi:hypothetical protein T484DRAFT_3477490 [Baffinella frigidus]|nr:hypothetical protein T484DRAFT_3477490 [Cryptophyta sp. CCMP2293]